ncbi:MAG: DUF2723 domain-containing protein [Caldilineaceae bacterium]
MSEKRALRLPPLFVWAAVGLAFVLYVATMAPGLTWANQGADGGELIAAARTNGVPHPPGYPLYMLLLQLWLKVTAVIFAGSEPARLGNLFSATLAAACVGVTVTVAAAVTERFGPARWASPLWRHVWALVIGLAWMQAPLFWGQAIIAEVYALHMLLVSILGWVLLAKGGAPRYLIPIVALGVAHHLTFVLLLPAALYLLWADQWTEGQTFGQRMGLLKEPMLALMAGGILGALFYIRIPLAAATGAPINWGYADNWEGFWWLVGAQAYRGYLFNVPADSVFDRIAGWAYTLTSQYSFVGLGLGLIGLAHWDQAAPRLRNFGLLWVAPLSFYAVSYYTRDSNIYLLPVIWMLVVWLAVGGPILLDWLRVQWAHYRPEQAAKVGVKISIWGILAALIGVIVLTAVRLPTMSLRQDSEARTFLNGVIAAVEPGSVVISSADQETFAIWYGAWGSGELLRMAPPPIFVNYALLQFPWYRRQLAAQYPDIPGLDQSLDQVIAANAGQHPIYFSEQLSVVPPEHLEPVGPIWRYKP